LENGLFEKAVSRKVTFRKAVLWKKTRFQNG